jgi:hypothetical protein
VTWGSGRVVATLALGSAVLGAWAVCQTVRGITDFAPPTGNTSCYVALRHGGRKCAGLLHDANRIQLNSEAFVDQYTVRNAAMVTTFCCLVFWCL